MREGYTDLIARFDGDVLAHNNLALCSSLIRNMPKAVSEMRRAVAILPKRPFFRINLALYASYGGDFQAGEQEALAAQKLASPLSLLALAFAQAGQERLADAAENYRNLGKVESLGPAAASWEASGLADLAIYEGRFSEAVKLLESGAAADLTAKSADRAAAKLVAAAYAQLSRGQKAAAIAAAEKALATSKAVKIRFLAGRILIESGQVARGRTIAANLAAEIQADPQAHAKILEGSPHSSPTIGCKPSRVFPTRTRSWTLGSATSISAACIWRRVSFRGPIQNSIGASSGGEKHCRCSWMRNQRSGIAHGVLLSGPRSRRAEERRIRRVVQ